MSWSHNYCQAKPHTGAIASEQAKPPGSYRTVNFRNSRMMSVSKEAVKTGNVIE
jgi:hypothetical protein